MRFDDPPSQLAFADYLAGVEGLEQRRGTLDQAIERLSAQSPHAQTIARLRCFRGINTLTAAGSPPRWASSGASASPASSPDTWGSPPRSEPRMKNAAKGQSPRRAPSTPDASWSRQHITTRAHHGSARSFRDRQRDQDPRVRPDRLASAATPPRTLAAPPGVRRNKPTGKVAVACARELSAFLWEAATLS